MNQEEEESADVQTVVEKIDQYDQAIKEKEDKWEKESEMEDKSKP